jgi:hypothetical protein
MQAGKHQQTRRLRVQIPRPGLPFSDKSGHTDCQPYAYDLRHATQRRLLWSHGMPAICFQSATQKRLYASRRTPAAPDASGSRYRDSACHSPTNQDTRIASHTLSICDTEAPIWKSAFTLRHRSACMEVGIHQQTRRLRVQVPRKRLPFSDKSGHTHYQPYAFSLRHRSAYMQAGKSGYTDCQPSGCRMRHRRSRTVIWNHMHVRRHEASGSSPALRITTTRQ